MAELDAEDEGVVIYGWAEVGVGGGGGEDVDEKCRFECRGVSPARRWRMEMLRVGGFGEEGAEGGGGGVDGDPETARGGSCTGRRACRPCGRSGRG